jgi:hypothetical protein
LAIILELLGEAGVNSLPKMTASDGRMLIRP